MNEVIIQQASVDELDKLVAWRMEVLNEVFALPHGRIPRHWNRPTATTIFMHCRRGNTSLALSRPTKKRWVAAAHRHRPCLVASRTGTRTW